VLVKSVCVWGGGGRWRYLSTSTALREETDVCWVCVCRCVRLCAGGGNLERESVA